MGIPRGFQEEWEGWKPVFGFPCFPLLVISNARILQQGRPKGRMTDEMGVYLDGSWSSGRFWKRYVPFVNARHLGTWAPPPKSESSASKSFRCSGIGAAFTSTFDVFTSVGPDNSLERFTERSVGLVTDQPRYIYELFVALFE